MVKDFRSTLLRPKLLTQLMTQPLHTFVTSYQPNDKGNEKAHRPFFKPPSINQLPIMSSSTSASDATSSIVGVSQLQLGGSSTQQTALTGGTVDSIFFPQQQRVRNFTRAKIELPVTSGCAKAGTTFAVELNNQANRDAFNGVGKVTVQSIWPAIRHKDESWREYRKPHKHACQDDYSFASLGGSSSSSHKGGDSSCNSSSSKKKCSSSSSSSCPCSSSSSSTKKCGSSSTVGGSDCSSSSSSASSSDCSSSSSSCPRSSSSSSCDRSSSSSASEQYDTSSSVSAARSQYSGSGQTGPSWEKMPACGEGEVVYYVNSHGNWAIRDAQFTVGPSQRIQNWGEHLEILDEMVEGKDTDETVGRFKCEEDLWRASRECNVRTARLHFFFTTEIAKILQIYRITMTKLALVITTRKLEQLFYSSDKSRPYKMDSECLLEESDIQFRVMADVYWFTPEEMAATKADNTDESYLIQEFQKTESNICCPADKMSAPIVVDLPFHNIVQGWIYFVQAEHHVCNKEWLNYSGRKGRDPVTADQLLINGMEASVKRSARDARVLSALETDGINVPTRHLYGTWFAIAPTSSAVATGGLDFEANFLQNSKQKIQQKLWLQRKLGRAKFYAFASSYNMFTIRPSGSAEIVYRQTPA
jgi:hypothetical protein